MPAPTTQTSRLPGSLTPWQRGYEDAQDSLPYDRDYYDGLSEKDQVEYDNGYAKGRSDYHAS